MCSRLSHLHIALIAALAVTLVPTAHSQTTVKLVPPGTATGHNFGVSVAVDGTVAVVGAPVDGAAGFNAGSVYVYRNVMGIWERETKLFPPHGSDDSLFGIAVDVQGETILVGAKGDAERGEGAGAVYLFRRVDGIWSQRHKFMPPPDSAWDRYGSSVAINGDLIVVGAYRDDDANFNAGAAYVYRNVSGLWMLDAKLLPPSDAGAGQLGYAVAASGDTVALGANHDAEAGMNAGAVYVFERTGSSWHRQAKLMPPPGSTHDQFGSAVAVDGDVVVAGAYRDDDAGGNAGAAYVCRRMGTGWIIEEKLTPPAIADLDFFGGAVAVSGNALVVGAVRDDDSGYDAGAVYVYRHVRGAWILEDKLVPPRESASDLFGFSVSIDAFTVFAAAPTDDDAGVDAGAVYVFGGDAADPFCPADLDEDGVVTFDDLLRVLTAWGSCGQPCGEDLDGDGVVGAGDVLVVLSTWGGC